MGKRAGDEEPYKRSRSPRTPPALPLALPRPPTLLPSGLLIYCLRPPAPLLLRRNNPPRSDAETCLNDWLPEQMLPQIMPNWHYLHIYNDVTVALQARDVTDEMLHTRSQPAPDF